VISAQSFPEDRRAGRRQARVGAQIAFVAHSVMRPTVHIDLAIAIGGTGAGFEAQK
jgi:hypothetical protein